MMTSRIDRRSNFNIIFSFCASLFLNAAALAQDSKATIYADAQAGLGDIVAPYIDASDGYSWLANRNFEPGEGDVVYWARKHGWGPGKTVAIGDVYGVYEDGTCQHHSHFVYGWEPSTGHVYREGFTRGNIQFRAIFDRTSDTKVDAYLTGYVRERGPINVLDRLDSAEQGVVYTRTFFREGKDWVSNGGERNAWRLEKPDNICGL